MPRKCICKLGKQKVLTVTSSALNALCKWFNSCSTVIHFLDDFVVLWLRTFQCAFCGVGNCLLVGSPYHHKECYLLPESHYPPNDHLEYNFKGLEHCSLTESLLVKGKHSCILFSHPSVSKPYQNATVHFHFLDFFRHELHRSSLCLPKYKINVSSTLIFKSAPLTWCKEVSTSPNSPSVQGDRSHSTDISKEFLLLGLVPVLIYGPFCCYFWCGWKIKSRDGNPWPSLWKCASCSEL